MPPEWFLEPLMVLTASIAKHTMVKHPIVCIRLDAEFGLQLGLTPSERMLVHTPTGEVEIISASILHWMTGRDLA